MTPAVDARRWRVFDQRAARDALRANRVIS